MSWEQPEIPGLEPEPSDPYEEHIVETCDICQGPCTLPVEDAWDPIAWGNRPSDCE